MPRTLLALTAALIASTVLVCGCAEQPEKATSGEVTKSTAPADTAKTTPASETTKTEDSTKPADATKTPDPNGSDPAKAGATKPADASAASPSGTPKEGDQVAVLTTDKGKIVIAFDPDKAPKHVANFIDLAKKGFYDGTRFHRCIPGFMIQGGDPNSKSLTKADTWGTGGYMENGSERHVEAEFNSTHHARGIVSMARSGDPNSASSQFFIVTSDSPSLDGQYSAFGHVVSGLDVADEIVKTGDAGNNGAVQPAQAVVLKSVKVTKWPVK